MNTDICSLQNLEALIENARKQMTACYENGDKAKARYWNERLRDLISERTPDRVAEMELNMGIRQ